MIPVPVTTADTADAAGAAQTATTAQTAVEVGIPGDAALVRRFIARQSRPGDGRLTIGLYNLSWGSRS